METRMGRIHSGLNTYPAVIGKLGKRSGLDAQFFALTVINSTKALGCVKRHSVAFTDPLNYVGLRREQLSGDMCCDSLSIWLDYSNTAIKYKRQFRFDDFCFSSHTYVTELRFQKFHITPIFHPKLEWSGLEQIIILPSQKVPYSAYFQIFFFFSAETLLHE